MAKLIAEVIRELLPWLVSVAIPSLGGFFGIRWFNKRQTLARLSDKQDADRQIKDLRSNIADQDVKIANLKAINGRLEQQVGELSHFKILYETLKEAHDALKIDHEELKAQLSTVKDRLAIAEKNAEEKTKENNDQRVFILALENKLSDNQRRREDLEVQLKTYREVIATLGLKLATDDKTTTPEEAPKENKTDE